MNYHTFHILARILITSKLTKFDRYAYGFVSHISIFKCLSHHPHIPILYRAHITQHSDPINVQLHLILSLPCSDAFTQTYSHNRMYIYTIASRSHTFEIQSVKSKQFPHGKRLPKTGPKMLKSQKKIQPKMLKSLSMITKFGVVM